MDKYRLMHKDDVCGALVFDEASGRVISYKDNQNGLSPFLGNFDVEKMRKWWEMRSVPASRTMIQNAIRDAGCTNTESYLAKNLALSMTDSYWICPHGMLIKYDEIKLRNLGLYGDGKMPYHNATSYDPNASLGGQMEKYWDLDYEVPILVKESYKYYGQQSVNEVFATYLHQMQNPKIPYVKYHAEITEDHGILCKCPAFTSDKIELISAYEVVESNKKQNDMAIYDSYIDICSKQGIDREEIQAYMDYMILTDFVISNTDEHLLNFGVLRDADTMKLIGPAPIFDSGNSMFFSDVKREPYTRSGMLERQITSFYKTEEKMLEKVKDKQIVKADLLPHRKDVIALYEKAGIPEWKTDVIAKNYETKLQFLNEFQHGKKISLYHERKMEKLQKSHTHKNNFIMLCGLPGSGKTETANKLCAEYECKGYEVKDSCDLCPAKDVAMRIGLFYDKKKMLDEIVPDVSFKKSVVLISENDIRKELGDIRYTDDLVFLIADMRIKKAIISGAEAVIFDASNLHKARREFYVDLVGNNVKKTLIVMNTPPERLKANITPECMQMLQNRLKENSPSRSEGWDDVMEYSPMLIKEATSEQIMNKNKEEIR